MAKVLIVGSGSREHALATGIVARDTHELLFAPGNAGTAALGRNVTVAADDVPALVELATAEGVDLVVVGPEAPLVAGLADALSAAGVRVFGPSRAAARLEGSKAFMKDVCRRAGVPTAGFQVFDDADAAKAYVRALGRPLVVKADGLCAGKGVVVAKDADEAVEAIEAMMVARAFGAAGARVVIEETLSGEEASFHVICDGTTAVPLVAAQDHKRIFDGDRGPNTGGMGAYAPAPVVTPDMVTQIMEGVVAPTLKTMRDDGAPFRGVLFVGLMIDSRAAKVLEFNVRFGDPETTVLVPMLDGDWFELLSAAADGDVGRVTVGTRRGAALAVVLAAEGYPAKPTAGDPIEGLEGPLSPSSFVFHAGTRSLDGRVVTAGGRVLTVAAHGATLKDARDRAYLAADGIRFRGMQRRSDIGYRALRG